MLETPILFIIFNRPESTRLVFDEIKRQHPKKLFVFADGIRPDNKDDQIKCLQTRSVVLDQIDWDCDLQTMFLDFNLGCGQGPARAITWFFQNVPAGIIIEDDCIPHPDFFKYCTELLEKYRDNNKIMVIGGATYRDDYPCSHSYTFSIYPTMTAWATWARVWSLYNYKLSGYSREDIREKLKKYFLSRFEYRNWLKLYDWMVADNFTSYWDWQLNFLMYMNDGIAIRPQKNLVKNIGFGSDATHTNYFVSQNFTANRETFACLPLNHPESVIISKITDSRYYNKMYKTPFVEQVQNKIKKYTRFILSKSNTLESAFK